jgi:hypothetical protein
MKPVLDVIGSHLKDLVLKGTLAVTEAASLRKAARIACQDNDTNTISSILEEITYYQLVHPLPRGRF